MATMYIRKFTWQLCRWGRIDICLTVHSRAILKTVKSMYNDIKNSTSATQLPHKFSYIVAILGYNHFESANTVVVCFLRYEQLGIV
jgi:hypothetical protein